MSKNGKWGEQSVESVTRRLFGAIEQGRLDKVKELISQGASLTEKIDNSTAIELATSLHALEEDVNKKGKLNQIIKTLNRPVGRGSGISEVEELFDAITNSDLAEVNRITSGALRGNAMRVQIDGLYPVQRALLKEATMDKLDPQKVAAKKIREIIEKKSKSVGIEVGPNGVIDSKKQGSHAADFENRKGQQKRRGESPGR